MREVASSASSLRRRNLPTSLIQRIELMQHYARAVKAQAEGRPAPIEWAPAIPSRRSQAVVLAWFGLGVLTSGAMGAGTVIGMRVAASGAVVLPSWTALAAWAKAPQPAPTPRRDAEWDPIEVTIDRSARARAPLPLEVTGTDDASVQVVMQGVPAGVRPSRGEQLGQSTWVLGRADLDALYLTIDDAAPDAFEMKIGVSMTPGTVVPASIVQLRLVDQPAPQQAAATGGAGTPAGRQWTDVVKSAAAPAAGPSRSAAAHGSEPAPGAPAHAPAQKHAATAADATGAQPGGGRFWPEGASGLGAVPREPGEATGLSWWQMPPPSWSPFLVGQERP